MVCQQNKATIYRLHKASVYLIDRSAKVVLMLKKACDQQDLQRQNGKLINVRHI